MLAGAGTDIDDPVGMANDVELVLDDEQRIAGRLQPVERAQQRLGVGRMQTRGRLVQHIDDAEQIGADLRREPQPLQFARRQRRRAAFEREIAEPEIEQHLKARRQVLAIRCATIAFSGCAAGVACRALSSATARSEVRRAASAAAATSRRCPVRRT